VFNASSFTQHTKLSPSFQLSFNSYILETLQQAVGEEPLRLLITVEEEDYRKGRLKLLQNLNL